MSVLDRLFQLCRIDVQHGGGVLPMSAPALKRALLGTVVALLVSTPLGSAWAQFDPDFNHLECYSIKAAQRFIKRLVTVETQFGVQTNVEVLKPIRLCLPAHKTGPGQDPLTPTPVPHFLCYTVKAKTLFPTDVTLTDQFGTLRERTKKPQLLCTPVVKVVTSPTTTSSTTTTSTSSTTTTSSPCQNFMGTGCYWQETISGNSCFVPSTAGFPSDIPSCKDLDSCSPNGGDASGGGCYRWADCSLCPTIYPNPTWP